MLTNGRPSWVVAFTLMFSLFTGEGPVEVDFVSKGSDFGPQCDRKTVFLLVESKRRFAIFVLAGTSAHVV